MSSMKHHTFPSDAQHLQNCSRQCESQERDHVRPPSLPSYPPAPVCPWAPLYQLGLVSKTLKSQTEIMIIHLLQLLKMKHDFMKVCEYDLKITYGGNQQSFSVESFSWHYLNEFKNIDDRYSKFRKL